MGKFEIQEIAIRHIKEHEQGSSEWDLAVYALSTTLNNTHKECLEQMAITPTYDGDIISKRHRDDLIAMKLANKVMFNNEFGYTSTNYTGGFILKCMKENQNG